MYFDNRASFVKGSSSFFRLFPCGFPAFCSGYYADRDTPARRVRNPELFQKQGGVVLLLPRGVKKLLAVLLVGLPTKKWASELTSTTHTHDNLLVQCSVCVPVVVVIFVVVALFSAVALYALYD
jgi:hypothetical protein